MGRGKAAITSSIRAGLSSGMQQSRLWRKNENFSFVGMINDPLADVTMAEHNTRNNQILQTCLQEIEAEIRTEIAKVGGHQFGIIAGTSTSGIAEAEEAILSSSPGNISHQYDYKRQEFGSPSSFVRDLLGTTGPCYAISTACTSSTNAFIAARRLLQNGLAKAVLVIGADSLCRTTVEGFIALEAVSSQQCLPMSANRCGINIGEASSAFLLTCEPGPIELLGVGESCDAYHLSSPDPLGNGAEAAMRNALKDANLDASEIAYVNLHGTGTIKNDQMEALAMSRVFPAGVICSSTKPLTGHTLGAAGAIEATLCCLAIFENIIPPHIWDGQIDPQIPNLRLAAVGEKFPDNSRRICMTNNFAFGGSNVSLIFGPTR